MRSGVVARAKNIEKGNCNSIYIGTGSRRGRSSDFSLFCFLPRRWKGLCSRGGVQPINKMVGRGVVQLVGRPRGGCNITLWSRVPERMPPPGADHRQEVPGFACRFACWGLVPGENLCLDHTQLCFKLMNFTGYPSQELLGRAEIHVVTNTISLMPLERGVPAGQQHEQQCRLFLDST